MLRSGESPSRSAGPREASNRVALAGDTLIATAWNSIRVIDVADPLDPRLLGALHLDYVAGVDVRQELAFAAVGKAGVRVIDVSDVAAPVFVGEVDTVGAAEGLEAAGHFVYVASWDWGFEVLDVSVP